MHTHARRECIQNPSPVYEHMYSTQKLCYWSQVADVRYHHAQNMSWSEAKKADGSRLYMEFVTRWPCAVLTVYMTTICRCGPWCKTRGACYAVFPEVEKHYYVTFAWALHSPMHTHSRLKWPKHLWWWRNYRTPSVLLSVLWKERLVLRINLNQLDGRPFSL